MKQFLKNHPLFLDILALGNNLINCPIAVFNPRVSCRGAFLRKVKIRVPKGASARISRLARISKSSIILSAQGNSLIIGGGHTKVTNSVFCCQDMDSRIRIGNDFTMEGGEIASIEGREVRIGNDCMFSFDIDVRNGDSHVILDSDGRRINYSEDIVIEDHVWLAAHTRILKGSVIPHNSIIGNSSLVSSKLECPNGLYVGIPARYIKSGVYWDRFRVKYPSES